MTSIDKGSSIVDGVRNLAWYTTKTVVKPLAPVAKAVSYLTLEQLLRLLPEPLAADVAVAIGALAAKCATLFTETPEGRACVTSLNRLTQDCLTMASTPESEKLIKELSESGRRLAKALTSQEAKKFYQACETTTQALLKLGGTSDAARAVTSTRELFEALLVLAASDASDAAVDDAVKTVAAALRDHRRDTCSETLSEDGSDDDEDDVKVPIRRRRRPRASSTSCCGFALTVVWLFLAAVGLYTLLGTLREDITFAPRPRVILTD